MAEKTQVAKVAATDSTCRVREMYKSEVVPYLMKHFNYKNVNQVPKLVKITINGGLGDVKDNAKSVQNVEKELALIFSFGSALFGMISGILLGSLMF